MAPSNVSKRPQAGFTLIEIGIVLVIIGLLLGTFLRAWELQVSARVRSLADSAQGVQAAYHGFVDRYRHVPGDWDAAAAAAAVGSAVTSGGNGNGRLDNPPGPGVYNETNALWEHLSRAGLITGAYAGTPNTEPDAANNLAPSNVYDSMLLVGRTSDYEGTNPVKLHVVVGRGVPVGVIRELDVKLDDGLPDTGAVRATLDDGSLTVFTATHRWGGREPGCVTAAVAGPAPTSGPPPPPPGSPIWNASSSSHDCNAVMLF